MKTFAALVLAVGLAACGGTSPEQFLETAQTEIAAGNFDAAAKASADGLAAGAAAATAWRLELIGLEASARAGKVDAALATLERLAGAHPDRVKGALYVSTAGQVKDSGDGAGAITILDAGAKRFPKDADVAKAIEQAKSASEGSEEMEMLRSLGYLD